MELVRNKQQEEKEGKEVSHLRVIQGGSDGGITSSGNWLLDLNIGDMFLVKDKRDPNNPLLGEFMLVAKDPSTEGDVVFLAGPDIPGGRKPFDPHSFCARYRKYRVVGTMDLNQKEEETEKSDDQGDRVQGDGTDSPEKLD